MPSGSVSPVMRPNIVVTPTWPVGTVTTAQEPARRSVKTRTIKGTRRAAAPGENG